MPEELFYTPAGIQVYSRQSIFKKLIWDIRSSGVEVFDYDDNYFLAFHTANLMYDMLVSQRSELLSRSPRTAEGLHLDDVVIDKGIVRQQATQAFVIAELEFNSPTEKNVVAGEIRLEHPLGQYMINQPFVQTTSIKQNVTFQVENEGEIGNLPILDDPELAIITGTGVTSAKQIKSGTGGYNLEGDRRLRERYFDAKNQASSLGNVVNGLKSINGILDARIFFNSDPTETIQGVIATHLGIAITTKGTYDDIPEDDWTEDVKKDIWNFLVDNLDLNIITSKKDAYMLEYKHITNYIRYYIKPLRYVTNTSVKVYIKGVSLSNNLFDDPIIKEEMIALGVAVRDYVTKNITSEFKTFNITTVVHDEFKKTDIYKLLPLFVKETKVLFAAVVDGELGGEVNITTKKNEVIGGVFEKEITYDKQENPHIEVILNEIS